MSNSGENCEFFYICFFFTFKSYVNHAKLWQMTNMKVEEFKLKIH
jgi:hypothetical protein